MTEPSAIVRVPALRPLTPMQLTVASFLGDGFDDAECCRLIGIKPDTFRTHLELAAEKIGGDLTHRRERLIVWQRGASAAVLGVDHEMPARQAALARAYAVSVGRACPMCGYLAAHDDHTEAGRRHQ